MCVCFKGQGHIVAVKGLMWRLMPGDNAGFVAIVLGLPGPIALLRSIQTRVREWDRGRVPGPSVSVRAKIYSKWVS